MKVTVKQYLEETHELSCIIEDKVSDLSGNVIIVDPFNWNAVENTGHDFRLVGRSMVDKVYDMSDYEIEKDVYYPKVFEEITVKTQPCPICGTPLVTPRYYFPALHKLNEKLEAYEELIIKNYEVSKKIESGICPQCDREVGRNELKANSSVCEQCQKQNSIDLERISGLISEGHTDHCAKRIVWGDGECECRQNKE